VNSRFSSVYLFSFVECEKPRFYPTSKKLALLSRFSLITEFSTTRKECCSERSAVISQAMCARVRTLSDHQSANRWHPVQLLVFIFWTRSTVCTENFSLLYNFFLFFHVFRQNFSGFYRYCFARASWEPQANMCGCVLFFRLLNIFFKGDTFTLRFF